MREIAIWGMGKNAKDLMAKKCFEEVKIVCFVDTYKNVESFEGIPVVYPEDLKNYKYDWIIITLADPGDVYHKCADLNIEEDKIIIVFNDIMKNYQHHAQNLDSIKREIPKLYSEMMQASIIPNQCMPMRRHLRDYVQSDEPILQSCYLNREYVRFRTMGLAADEVREIEGDWDVAELGVWQGGVSRLISLLFPTRKIYMFDTFESFDQSEVKNEIEKGYCDEKFANHFRDTSVERVLSIMPYVDNCVIRKGFFPDTAYGLENNRYGFVSLDVDLEKSTYEGLKYFVPRMIEGGYIFLHDYNHVSLKGVKNAVQTYEADNNIRLRKVPLCDSDGTLILSF